jgi:hypothetical protein
LGKQPTFDRPGLVNFLCDLSHGAFIPISQRHSPQIDREDQKSRTEKANRPKPIYPKTIALTVQKLDQVIHHYFTGFYWAILLGNFTGQYQRANAP